MQPIIISKLWSRQILWKKCWIKLFLFSTVNKRFFPRQVTFKVICPALPFHAIYTYVYLLILHHFTAHDQTNKTHLSVSPLCALIHSVPVSWKCKLNPKVISFHLTPKCKETVSHLKKAFEYL